MQSIVPMCSPSFPRSLDLASQQARAQVSTDTRSVMGEEEVGGAVVVGQVGGGGRGQAGGYLCLFSFLEMDGRRPS